MSIFDSFEGFSLLLSAFRLGIVMVEDELLSIDLFLGNLVELLLFQKDA
jgi:hypothetical protein